MPISMNDGRPIPDLGIGTYGMDDDQAAETLPIAIDLGYRLIDTASLYGNEEGVGRGIAATALPRDDLFVQTKVWNADHGYDATVAALEASLARLGLDHVDAYLIHWPVPHRELYVDTWRAMVDLRERGLTRTIGVSNFAEEHLDRLTAETGVVPAVNQIELHPYFQQAAMRAANAERGVITQSWSPLGRGTDALADATIARIAEEVGASPGQVILRWHEHIGALAVPKSASPERLRENIEASGISLGPDHLAALASLDRGLRVGGDPHTNET